MIAKQQLLDFGMIESEEEDRMIIPMYKNLDEEGFLQLAVSRMRNENELILVCPDGIWYLGGCSTIEELRIIEKSVTEWEMS